jgi:hypothetical protein
MRPTVAQQTPAQLPRGRPLKDWADTWSHAVHIVGRASCCSGLAPAVLSAAAVSSSTRACGRFLSAFCRPPPAGLHRLSVSAGRMRLCMG